MAKKILFVCHGNICRSPMAEYVMKDIVKKEGLENEFEITSGAVSDEEWFNPIYPPAQRKLREKGVPFGHHSAHKISKTEFDAQDIVIVMDRSNLRWLTRIVGDLQDKVHMMMEYAGQSRDVAYPWYTGDFEQTYQDVLAGCKGLLEQIR